MDKRKDLESQPPDPLSAGSRKPSTGVPSKASGSGGPLTDPRPKAPPQGGSRPPPAPGAARGPPREKNEFYKDVERTGKWGNMSKKEIYIVVAAILIAVVAVVVVVVVFVINNDDSGPAATPRTPSPTPSPTNKPNVPAITQLAEIRRVVANNTFASTNLQLLPEVVASYEGESFNPSSNYLVRAASWIMFVDPLDAAPLDPLFVPRYVLTMLYYAFGGDGWINRGGWLSGADICSWYGVNCDRLGKYVHELDLSDNNLVGTIPSEINMLSDLRALWLRGNQLTGTIPHLAIGSLPELTILYVDNNMLTGTISTDLRANGVLSKSYSPIHFFCTFKKCCWVLTTCTLTRSFADTIFVQRNNLTGFWPRRQWCPRTGDPPILQNYGLDCLEVRGCPSDCCDGNNCF